MLCDFGDAPTAAQSGLAASYPTLLADDGARHTITEISPQFGLFNGDAPDSETDGQPSADAQGDETSGQADENPLMFSRLAQPLAPGETAAFSVAYRSLEVDAFVSLWIDWNRDGDWVDAGEQILSDVRAPAMAGSSLLFNNRVTVPLGTAGGTTFARARISSVAGLGTTGAAPDGEVEDFVVTVVRPSEAGSISGHSYVDVNHSGTLDATERALLGTQIVLLDGSGTMIAETFSDADGAFRFDGLAAGTYTIRKVQPPLFIDGKDTPGPLGDSDTAEDQFTLTLPRSVDAAGYLFAERGLLPQFIGKSQYLASTSAEAWEGLDLALTDFWYPFQPQALELQAVVDFSVGGGDAAVELFDARMQPLETLRPSDPPKEAAWRIAPGEMHYLRVSGSNRDVDVSLQFIDAADANRDDGDIGRGRDERGGLAWAPLDPWMDNDALQDTLRLPASKQIAVDAALGVWDR